MKNLLASQYLNIFLGIIFASFILFASKHIGDKKSILFNNYFKLFLLSGILIIYPYNKQAGIIILIIVIVLQSALFKEKFIDFVSTTDNELEKIESNYNATIVKRKQEKGDDAKKNKESQDRRLNMYQDEGLIDPLEKAVIEEIQQKFNADIDLLSTDDFKTIAKYTDEGDPINAGLLPEEIEPDKAGINYEDLIKTGEIIKF
jgi:hypothetical protein